VKNSRLAIPPALAAGDVRASSGPSAAAAGIVVAEIAADDPIAAVVDAADLIVAAAAMATSMVMDITANAGIAVMEARSAVRN
jgi:hypothetical protein